MVVVKVGAGAVTDEALESFIDKFVKEVRSQKRSFVTVLDLRNAGGITARQRRYMSERIRSNSEQGDKNVASAFVFSSRMMRGLLTAILWMRNPEYPCETFGDIDSAVAWGRAQLAARPVLSVPPSAPAGSAPVLTPTTTESAVVPTASNLPEPEVMTRAVAPTKPMAPSNLAEELRRSFPEPSPEPTSAVTLSSTEAEEKLRTLQSLFDKGLINQDELAQRRREVLDKL